MASILVVTKNGLWIKDKIINKIIITNSSSMSENYIIDNFITEFMKILMLPEIYLVKKLT